MPTYKLVMLRHGESLWNQENRFTGWRDIDLSAKGIEEAKQAGQLIAKEGFNFDVAYTSVLKRAIRTLWSIMSETDQMWLPVHRAWQLNERHYGALQGLNKKETVDKYGEKQVFEWRRSYATPPPAMSDSDPGHPSKDRRYKSLKTQQVPSGESLKNTLERVIPYWQEVLAPRILSEEKVLIVAHGNSMRALIKYLDKVSEEEISELNIPTGIPLVYELDKDLKPLKHYYLGDADAAKKAAEAVANQSKK